VIFPVTKEMSSYI